MIAFGLADPVLGEIWLSGFDPIIGHEQGGERPWFNVSDDRFNHGRSTLVIVVSVAWTDRGLVSQVRIDA